MAAKLLSLDLGGTGKQQQVTPPAAAPRGKGMRATGGALRSTTHTTSKEATTMSTSSGGVLSESDLEAAKYPLKHNLCVDALAGGFFDAFVDLFRISHPEVTARDQPPAAPVEYLNPADRPGTLSDEQMVQLKQDLCNAEFYGRQGTSR